VSKIKWCGNARLSECMLYRYRLCRWLLEVQEPEHEPYVLFVGLNPSTADASIDDNTVRAWMRLTLAWGFRMFVVGNVYAYRSRNPKALWKVADPIGPANGVALLEMAREAAYVVACWGNHAQPKHCLPVLEQLTNYKPVYCLGRNENGTPKHPLFLPTDVERVLYAPCRRAA